MNLFKHFMPFFFVFFATFFSCSAKFTLDVQDSTTFSTEIAATAGERTYTLVRNLSETPEAGQKPLFDAVKIKENLAQNVCVSSIGLKNPDVRSISGTFTVTNFEKFLSPGFITVEKTGAGNKISFYLDLAHAPHVAASLSPEVNDYLNAFMAPLVTGEKLTSTEYLALVQSVYGDTVAKELKASRVTLVLRCPGPVVSVRGGTRSGNRAEFTIMLPDLLSLEKPLQLDATWK